MAEATVECKCTLRCSRLLSSSFILTYAISTTAPTILHVDNIIFLASIPSHLLSRFYHSLTHDTEQISYVSGGFSTFKISAANQTRTMALAAVTNPYSNQGSVLG